MANQTRQLYDLLRTEGASVELVPVNPPFRPAWLGRLRFVRAAPRLAAYLVRLWAAAGRADLVHVMASSGWAWHLFSAPAIWVASLRGVPVVVNYRGGQAEEFFRRSFPWVRPTLARAQAVIVPSAFLERIFAARGVSVTVIPNIIDLTRFAPREGRPAGGLVAAPHVVVARNLEPIYDIPTALRAFRLIHERRTDAKLSVAGSGPERDRLLALARDLGLSESVQFTGRLDNAEMALLYRRADLVLNPSLADNMPVSILEALASGVPIVSTKVGGIPDLVEDGVAAVLIPPGDAEAMADAALALLDDAERRDRLTEAGFQTARRYTWDLVRPQLVRLYVGLARRQTRA